MPTRRHFIAQGLSGTSLVSLAGAVPLFIPRSLQATPDIRDERILVVIELAGGNDGINTVVPFRDEGYEKHRRALRLPADRLIRINDELALHPSTKALADIWNSGQLAIVQGVGYPNPNRSHFRSMEIWHAAIDSTAEHHGLGWIGKGLDRRSATTTNPLCMSIGQQATPLALRGSRAISSSVHRTDQYLISDRTLGSLLQHSSSAASESDDLLQFVQRVQSSALRTTAELKKLPREKGSTAYPETQLGRQLKLTAQLIKAGMSSRVYYTQQDGYDTHAGQLPQHASLLRVFSDSLSAFLSELGSANLTDRVTVMAFSEFGRRVAENGTAGTDHGTAGPVFLAGANVTSGIHGKTPNLIDLAGGDLTMSVDFRHIYAALLEIWLNVPSIPALGRSYQPLAVIKSGSSRL